MNTQFLNCSPKKVSQKWWKTIFKCMKIYHWAFTIILTLKVSSFVLLCLLSFSFCVCVCVCVSCYFVCFIFLSAVVLATWSNLVAYLWHSLAIVLMDVEGVKSASRQERSFTKTDSGWRTEK